MAESQKLKQQIIRATKWSALSELASKAMAPLVFVVLARMLTPEDFGVAAAAAIVVSFSQVFWDAGLGKALIQREGEIETAANVVFWSNACLSMVIYGLLFVLSDIVALIFKDPRIAAVLRVQGVQLILAALGSVQTALFQRQFNFKTLFWVRLLTTTFPALASIPLAWMGYSYWALVAGSISGAIVQLLVLWILSQWRPRLTYDFVLARQLFSFGVWVTGSGLLGWFYLWADSLVVGAFLDVHSLGLYRTGNALILMVFGCLLNPILPILYSALSRMQNNFVRLRESLLQATKIIAAISLPVAFGLYLVSEPLSVLLFGTQWPGVGQVIGVMALMRGISWVVAANTEAYRALGRPDLETKIMLLMLMLYLPTYLLTVSFGLHVFLWIRFALAFLALPVHLYVAKKYLDIKLIDLITRLRWILPLSGLVTLICYIIMFSFEASFNGAGQMIFIVILFVMIYGLLLYCFERNFIKNLSFSFKSAY